jgi:Peptidase family M23
MKLPQITALPKPQSLPCGRQGVLDGSPFKNHPPLTKMKIFRAVKTSHINQGFGLANTSPDALAIYKAMGWLGHEGVDFGVSCVNPSVQHGGQCEPVYCDLDIQATISIIQTSDTLGFGIVAETFDKDGRYEHLWWHLDSIAPTLKVGSIIESGTFLGISGNTGRSTGAHLHRGLTPMGIDTYGNYYKLQPNNGYGGAIDIMPYFTDEFILDVVNNLEKEIGILQKLINVFKKLLNI